MIGERVTKAEGRRRFLTPLHWLEPLATVPALRSKSNRLSRSGAIVNPHFGHVLSSEARTFFKSVFRDRGTKINLASQRSKSESLCQRAVARPASLQRKLY